MSPFFVAGVGTAGLSPPQSSAISRQAASLQTPPDSSPRMSLSREISYPASANSSGLACHITLTSPVFHRQNDTPLARDSLRCPHTFSLGLTQHMPRVRHPISRLNCPETRPQTYRELGGENRPVLQCIPISPHRA